jgi:hypothetical protein
VAVIVEVGTGLIGQVGSITGVGEGRISVNPPHPIENRAIAVIAGIVLCNLL